MKGFEGSKVENTVLHVVSSQWRKIKSQNVSREGKHDGSEKYKRQAGDTDLVPGPEGHLYLILNNLSAAWARAANFQHGFIPHLQ